MESSVIVSVIVILLRTFVPLTILKWPLPGGILSMLTDAFDVMILELFNTNYFGINYHLTDKVFDMWYLFFAFLVVRKWEDKLAKNTGIILFVWRFIGFLIFIIFGFRVAFFFAPNIFEFFFLAVLIIKKFNKKFKFTWKNLIIILLIVGIPNIIKEYLMHYKYPGQVWYFFKDNYLNWLYG